MPSRRIVVVDDDREVAAAFGAVLRDLGHSVECAYDAHHAIQLVRTLRPSLAFVDLVMPDVDGHELARRFREEYSRAELALVAVTGFANEAFLAQAESAFDACLAKPVAIDSLVELMTASP